MSNAIEGASVNIATASESFTKAGADPSAAAKFSSLLAGADAQSGSSDGIVTSSELKSYEKSLTMALKDEGKQLASELRSMFDKVAQAPETKAAADTKSPAQPGDTSETGATKQPAADAPSSSTGTLDVSDQQGLAQKLVDTKAFSKPEDATQTVAIFTKAAGEDGQLTRSELEGAFKMIMESAQNAGPEQKQALNNSIQQQLKLFDHLTQAQTPPASSAQASDSTTQSAAPAAAPIGQPEAAPTDKPAADTPSNSSGTLSLGTENDQMTVAKKLVETGAFDVKSEDGMNQLKGAIGLLTEAAGEDGKLTRPELVTFLENASQADKNMNPQAVQTVLSLFDAVTGNAPTASAQPTAPGGQPEASQAPGQPSATSKQPATTSGAPADATVAIKVGDQQAITQALTTLLGDTKEGPAVASQTAGIFKAAGGEEGLLTRPKLEAFLGQLKTQDTPGLEAPQKDQLIQQTLTLFDLLVKPQSAAANTPAAAPSAPAGKPEAAQPAESAQPTAAPAPSSAPGGQPEATQPAAGKLGDTTTTGSDANALQNNLNLQNPQKGESLW